MIRQHSTGRIIIKDLRDEEYPLVVSIPKKQRRLTQRYWNQDGWYGNQGQTSKCVAYGWTHWLEDGPITQDGTPPPIVDPNKLYSEAQKIDEFPGENYDGTTVRAGAKVLQSWEFISQYYWATNFQTIIDTILYVGPVVVGTWWFDSMFTPNKSGFVKVVGTASAGHCYVLNGCNVKQKKFRLKNSWGRDWGLNGSAYISFADFEKLFGMDGEVCLATEIKK